MEKLTQQRKILLDLENLIDKMESEIESLRNINYRYYIKNGEEIQDGVVVVPEYISFYIEEVDGKTLCRVIDHESLGIESNYQKIKKELNKLK